MSDLPPAGPEPQEDLLARCERFVIVVLFCGMTVLGALQVATRYLLAAPISNLEQLLPHLFVCMSFLGLGAAFRTRGNIAVTILTDAMTPGARRVYEIGLWLTTIGFMAAIAWSAGIVLLFQLQIGARTNMGYPAALLTATVPIGCALSILRIVQVELAPLVRGRPRA
jgi:TRAP-type C4-dicarboxylate transport system permease small subunit